MKHTPLPWKKEIFNGELIVQDDDTNEYYVYICDCSSEFMSQEEEEANAEFIVRACNSHYELLEACKRTVEMFDKNSTAMNELPYTYTRLKQVIAKAEGKE